jgi:hypothetical protein
MVLSAFFLRHLRFVLMSDRVFYCPGCRQQYADSRLPPRGELFDCPRCHLLFIPADKDFAGGVGPRDYEAEWADDGFGRRNPRPPFSRPTAHRRKKFKPHDLVIAWVTGIALLGIAWVLFVMVHTQRPTNKQFSPPIADAPAPSLANTSSSDRSDAEPPVPPLAGAAGAPKSARLEEATILGEWESPETPLLGVVGGEVFSMTFNPRGALTVQARTVLEIATLNGGWKLSGSMLTLKLGGQEIPLTAELNDSDTLRLTVGGKAAEFKRKK